MMEWIDTHAHIEDEGFDQDRKEVLDRARKQGMRALIIPGCDEKSSRLAMEVASKYEDVYAQAGVHPHEAKHYTASTRDFLSACGKDGKIVAIGEIGLDYHYDFSPRAMQQRVFEEQLQLALELELPVVIHSREAAADTKSILKNFGTRIQAVLHSFSETPKDWEDLAQFGYFISLGGMVTFKNAAEPKALAKIVPLDRLMLETDAPYLAPVPKRGRRNEPAYIPYVLEGLAALRKESVMEIAAQTTANALRFFRLPITDVKKEMMR